MEKALTPADVAHKMDISPSTLRKYSLLLEENGVIFKRNAKNSRQYTESDVMTLQRMITLMKTDGVTVENAAYTVSMKVESVSTETAKDGVIRDDSERHNADVAGVTLNEIRKLKEEIKEQRETIDGFRISQEKRDSYFVEILEQLQGEIQRLNEQAALPEPEVQSEPSPDPYLVEIIEGLRAQVQQLSEAAASKDDEPKEEKTGFFSRFFK